MEFEEFKKLTTGHWKDRTAPTAKQLKLLRELGCDLTPENMHEAESLIDAYLAARDGRYEPESEI